MAAAVAAVAGWAQPRQLVMTSASDGRLHAVEATVAALAELRTPLHVVSVTGVFREGKSHLMNRLFLPDRAAEELFRVGGGYESVTAGLWCVVVEIGGRTVVVLDLEGQEDPWRRHPADGQYFALSVLLSSCLLVNTMDRSITDHTLRRLSLVTSLSQFVYVRTDESAERQPFPDLMLVLRDQEQQGPEVDAVLSAMFLRALESRQTGGDTETRALLLDTFGKERLSAFGLVKHSEAAFEEGVARLRDRIVGRLEPLMITPTLPAKGRAFCRLLDACLAGLNNGARFDIRPSLPSLFQAECQDAADAALAQYRARIGPLPGDFPVNDAQLQRALADAMAACEDLYAHQTRGIGPAALEHLGRLRGVLDGERTVLERDNMAKSREFCRDLLQRLARRLESRVVATQIDAALPAARRGPAATKGAYTSLASFDDEVEILHVQYLGQARGPAQDDCWGEWLAADQALIRRSVAGHLRSKWVSETVAPALAGFGAGLGVSGLGWLAVKAMRARM